MRLIDEQGREVPPGEAGEVVGRSAGMMSGYHGQPEKTREVEWFDAAGQRFIRTGDIGRFDEDGFLILFDRRKDMIISGGFNIYPSDLEGVLRGHEAVADVAVVGVPSAEWGETPVAYVVAKPGSAASDAELREWCNARVGKTQRLAAVHLIAELPRSPSARCSSASCASGTWPAAVDGVVRSIERESQAAGAWSNKAFRDFGRAVQRDHRSRVAASAGVQRGALLRRSGPDVRIDRRPVRVVEAAAR